MAHIKYAVYFIILYFVRTTRFQTFPNYLLIHMRKFTIGEDWTPKKLGRFCKKVYLYVFRNVKFDAVGFVIRYIYITLKT